MTIRSKFQSTCRICRRKIRAGEEVEWSKGEGVTCPVGTATCIASTVRPTSTPVSEPGVYETTEGIFVVKVTRDKARLYASRLVEINAQRATVAGERVEIEFEYEPGAIYKLTPEDKMDVERAKALTILYGRCIVCGRHLKAAESVERGIGPICIKSFALAAG